MAPCAAFWPTSSCRRLSPESTSAIAGGRTMSTMPTAAAHRRCGATRRTPSAMRVATAIPLRSAAPASSSSAAVGRCRLTHPLDPALKALVLQQFQLLESASLSSHWFRTCKPLVSTCTPTQRRRRAYGASFTTFLLLLRGGRPGPSPAHPHRRNFPSSFKCVKPSRASPHARRHDGACAQRGGGGSASWGRRCKLDPSLKAPCFQPLNPEGAQDSFQTQPEHSFQTEPDFRALHRPTTWRRSC